MKHPTTALYTRIDSELHAEIKATSEASGIPMATIVEVLLCRALGRKTRWDSFGTVLTFVEGSV